MLGKLAVALRSIASALEEIEENKGKAGWEVVEEVEEQPQEPPPTCQPCGSDVAYHKDIRYYIVLGGGRKPELRGLWSGEASVAWRTLESQLVGGKLAGSGSRLRRGELQPGCSDVGEAVPGRGDDPFQGGSSGSGRAAASIGQVIQEWAGVPVAQGPLAGTPLSQALADPAFVASAARWRGGEPGKKIGAAMAKIMKAVREVRPGTMLGASTVPEPPVAQPVPLEHNAAEKGHTQTMKGKLKELVWRWSPSFSWTSGLVLLGLALMFPKLAASLVILVLRLVVRAIGILIARFCGEVYREVSGLVWSALQATWVWEDVLVQQLEAQWSWFPVSQRESGGPVAPDQTSHHQGPSPGGTSYHDGLTTLPCPPWSPLRACLP